jgi:hypothetical protein
VSPLQLVFGSVHFPQSRRFSQPSFVSPHSTVTASQDLGVHVEAVLGWMLPGRTQRFVAVSQVRSAGQGQVFCVKSIGSTPHAANTANETMQSTINRVENTRPPSFRQPRSFARNIWK